MDEKQRKDFERWQSFCLLTDPEKGPEIRRAAIIRGAQALGYDPQSAADLEVMLGILAYFFFPPSSTPKVRKRRGPKEGTADRLILDQLWQLVGEDADPKSIPDLSRLLFQRGGHHSAAAIEKRLRKIRKKFGN